MATSAFNFVQREESPVGEVMLMKKMEHSRSVVQHAMRQGAKKGRIYRKENAWNQQDLLLE